MTRTCRLVAALLMATVSTTPRDLPAQSTRDATSRAIDAANTRSVEAYNAGDVHAFARIYAPEATLLPPHGAALHGQQAIEQFWQGGWKMGIRNVKLATTELDVHGNTAAEVGTYRLDVQSNGGPPAHDHGKYIVLWRRNGAGDWQWYRDIFNSDLPAAGGAASTPARAGAGDSVWVIHNPVKAERRGDFEEFARAFWGAGSQSADSATRRLFATTRVLIPAAASADGSYDYIFLMDPVLPGANYEIGRLLRVLFPESEATRVGRLLSNARSARPSSQVLVQTTAAAATSGPTPGAPR